MLKSRSTPACRRCCPSSAVWPRCSAPTARSCCTTSRRLPHSIVAIENGAVTGRTVGDVPTDRMLRTLRNADETQDVRLYVSSHDGKILKSLAVTLRDEDGEPFGLLGLNHDISEVVQAQRALANLTAVGRLGGDAVPEAGEIFAGDIRDVVAGMITKILARDGQDAGGDDARGEDGGRQAPRGARRLPRQALGRAGRRGPRPLALHDLQLPQGDPARRRPRGAAASPGARRRGRTGGGKA